MSVKPGEIIHIGQFSSDKLSEVLRYNTEIRKREMKEKRFFQNPLFSLE